MPSAVSPARWDRAVDLFTLLMGMAFGYIVQKTGSIWGAVLGHFIADFFLLLGYFATMG